MVLLVFCFSSVYCTGWITVLLNWQGQKQIKRSQAFEMLLFEQQHVLNKEIRYVITKHEWHLTLVFK